MYYHQPCVGFCSDHIIHLLATTAVKQLTKGDRIHFIVVIVYPYVLGLSRHSTGLLPRAALRTPGLKLKRQYRHKVNTFICEADVMAWIPSLSLCHRLSHLLTKSTHCHNSFHIRVYNTPQLTPVFVVRLCFTWKF